MKKLLVLIIACMANVYPAQGCDVCGCSLGGNYFGILPRFNKSFVGLRWSQATFHADVHASSYLPAQYSDDTYNTVELWGRYYINERVQVFAFVPYVYNTMNGSDQVVSTNGLGDITLMTNYLMLNTGEDKDRVFRHSLLAGGGVKLPTGQFSAEDKGKLINRNFQTGTGSVDFLLASVYTVRYKKLGANVESGYKINTRNTNDYLFGNQFHVSTQVFVWQDIKSFSLLPNAGLYYETGSHHRDAGIIQVNTGGTSLLATAGLETYYRDLTLGLGYKHPIAQHYNSDESASIMAKDRWTVSLAFNF